MKMEKKIAKTMNGYAVGVSLENASQRLKLFNRSLFDIKALGVPVEVTKRTQKISVYAVHVDHGYNGYSGHGVGLFTDERIMDIGMDDLLRYLNEGKDTSKKGFKPSTSLTMAAEIFAKYAKAAKTAKDGAADYLHKFDKELQAALDSSVVPLMHAILEDVSKTVGLKKQ